ncbi:MAG: hypothetical protein U1E62_10820 [Alsobacter sp.]
MSFWSRLRWTATFAFIALLVLSWIGNSRFGSPSSDARGPRMAPVFHR